MMYKRPLFFAFLALCIGIWLCESFHIPFLFEPVLPAKHIKNFTLTEPIETYITAKIVSDPVVQEASYNRQKTAFIAEAVSLLVIARNDERERGVTKQTPIKEIASLPSVARNDGMRVCGLINVSTYDDRDVNLEYGDYILIKGELSKPYGLKNPGCFDYDIYLARQGIYRTVTVNKGDFISIIKKNESKISLNGIFKFKRKLLAVIKKYIPGEEADVLRGILLGDKSLIEKNLNDKFIKTGTIHILVVSGLNVGLIASIFILIFNVLRLPRYITYPLASLLVAVYAVLTGLNPPVARAAIVTISVLAGILLSRKVDILNCLGLSGIIILLKNPQALFGPSFQLSFCTILSIIILSPKIEEAFDSNNNTNRFIFYIKQSIAVSLAAWLGIIPIIAYNFNIISPVCILANIPVVFIVFVITAAGMAFLAAGLFMPFIAVILGNAVEFLTYILIKTVVLFSKIPLGFFWVHRWNALEIASFYVVLTVFGISLYKKEFRKSYVVISVLIFLNILVWGGVLRCTKYDLRCTVLNVGHGDAIVLEFPGGGSALIDTGKKSKEIDIGESVVGPYLRSRRINRIGAIFITHADDDHAGGLSYILKNFKVANVFGPNNLKFGDKITGFKDTQILVLNPLEKIPLTGEYDKNNNSLVLKVINNNRSFLFCADIENEAMKRLLAYAPLLESDVIKIPHHGAALGGEGREFMRLVSAKIAIISAARKDASLGLLELLHNAKCKVYQTYECGAIRLILKDGQISLEI